MHKFFSMLLALFVASRVAAAETSPVRHVVLLKFSADASAATVERVIDEFEALPRKIPGIVGFQWGRNNSPEGLDKGFTHAFLMTFDGVASRDSYLEHPAHVQFVEESLRPAIDEAFVFDFAVDTVVEAAAPGRVHHIVFFKFKEDAEAARLDDVRTAFADLERQIPGLLDYQAGADNLPEPGLARGFTDGFLLTFIHEDARDDYLPHPAHRAFGQRLEGLLDDVLVVDFTVRPSGRTLLVTKGLEPYRVYQRNDHGVADLEFKGLASSSGPIEARLLQGRRVVSGFDWQEVGKAEHGLFEARLPAVPTGGEYTVEVRRRDAFGNVAETTGVAHVLVGDLWILAGQSNMQGVGDLEGLEPPQPLMHAFTMSGRWELAVEPLHWLIDSRDPVHYGNQLEGLDEEGRREKRKYWRMHRPKGAGLGLPFAARMVEHTGVPVGLIASAHGGTSMSQWNPALRDKGGESLYGSMLKQVRRAGGAVRGVLWYQGESDANANAAPHFPDRFKTLIAELRKDLKSPELPFYYVQIGRFVIDEPRPEWKDIQEYQRTLAEEIPHTAAVSVIDLPLDDLIHVGTGGLKRVGARLARIARRRLFEEAGLHEGPRLASVKAGEGETELRVEFSGVNGRLLPAQSVAGFSIRGAAGNEIQLIYKVRVDPERPNTVVVKLRSRLPDEASLWYGAGLNPFCNLVDAEDMAVLAFGPVAIER